MTSQGKQQKRLHTRSYLREGEGEREGGREGEWGKRDTI